MTLLCSIFVRLVTPNKDFEGLLPCLVHKATCCQRRADVAGFDPARGESAIVLFTKSFHLGTSSLQRHFI